MPATHATRKPVVKLKIGDLRTFPIWEYAVDEEGDGEQDETWVRPVDSGSIPKGKYSQIVAAEFLTPAGSKLHGFMIVSTAVGKVSIDPGAVVGRIGYRVLPHLSRKLALKQNAPWDVDARDRLLTSLRAREQDVFPLQFSLRVPVKGESAVRTGTLQ